MGIGSVRSRRVVLGGELRSRANKGQGEIRGNRTIPPATQAREKESCLT